MQVDTKDHNTKSQRKNQPAKPVSGYHNFRVLKRQIEIIERHLAKIHEQKPEVTKQDLLNEVIDYGIQGIIIGPGLSEAGKKNSDAA